MTDWRPTPALTRAVLVAVIGLAGGVVTGSPELVVLAAPFLLPAALGLVGRPRTSPRVTARLEHHQLHEGQGTRSILAVDEPAGVEHVTRVAGVPAYVATEPRSGAVGALLDDGLPVLAWSPRRWGRREVGNERVVLTSWWQGFRWAPDPFVGGQVLALPQPAPYDSVAEAPQPVGLVGAHRSARAGGGTEFAGIRPFATGDRLRRINWRVSLRTGELHVVSTRAEEDAAVVLVVDALRDQGRSEGVDGRASSLDLAVRAAAALGEHHIRRGDRVGLEVLGQQLVHVAPGSGRRHLRRLVDRIAQVRPPRRPVADEVPELGIGAGSIVYVLSPLLDAPTVGVTARLLSRGITTVVVDTLADQDLAELGGPSSPAALAWRMRRLERDALVRRVAELGCPVVEWRGAGSLDEVMHRLARRAQLPRVRAR